MSWLRPAKGCRAAGSKEAPWPPRKDETSCTVEGSKGAGRSESAGSCKIVEEEEGAEYEEDVEDLEGDRPVSVSQRVMFGKLLFRQEILEALLQHRIFA